MPERADSTCWTLVRSAAAGDPESQAAYCRLYAPVISSYLAARWRRARDHQDVSDGVQEVFMQCFKPGGALGRADSDRPGGFRAFLYGITRNVAGTIEASRARRVREQGGGEEIDLVPSDDATVSRVFDRAFAQVLTREARRLLAERATPGSPAATRLRALELMYEKGLPSREIAKELGLDVGAVYPMLTRARKEFRATLLEVIAVYHPEDTREALEERWNEVFAAL
jgi:RNA polymerase sigma-70 factor (ECF subfamily)